MDIEVLSVPQGVKGTLWRSLLARAGLTADETVAQTVLVWDGDALAAAGSRQGDLLKCIAVAPERQGEDLLATVLTTLRQSALREGRRRLFLYTKPENRALFGSLFFYPVAQTDRVLLMEDRRNGIRTFLDGLPAREEQGAVGAAVMHCDPFTLGHRHLIETAAGECGWFYVFVLSEDGGRFSPEDRMEMVKAGTRDLDNVTVLPTGPYLISSVTFPTYFLKDRDSAAELHCLLDIEIFVRHFVPRFRIARRYVGTEPLSLLTDRYNEALREYLPRRGVALREVERLTRGGVPVSASAVRGALDVGDWETVRTLTPQTTFDFLQNAAP